MGLQGYVGSSQDQTRIRRQEKQREDERRKIEEIKKETEAKVVSAGLRRFGTGTSEALDVAFKNETVGLVTREEFLQKRNSLAARIESEGRSDSPIQKGKKQQKRPKPQMKTVLSFDEEEEDGHETKVAKQKETDRKERRSKYGKCPTVETEFLPDADREREEEELREKLKQEWKERQEAVKAERINLVYCYWDGTGHRPMQKGMSIGEFLKAAKEQLSKDFRELRLVSVENLLFVKDDVMIPHTYTFYELNLCKARGKSGLLFDFDAPEETALQRGLAVEAAESPAAKVVERHWYDQNKHIFPASRWEVYDPDKSYTTQG